MLDRLFNMTEKKERQRLQSVLAPPRPQTRPQPPPRPRGPVFEVFDRESRTWTPQEIPLALPCPLAGRCQGQPLMGIAVVDARMAFDLPMELVPPKEAVSGGPLILEKGGCFLFSDDYVEQNPESKVAELVHKFEAKRQSKMRKERVAQKMDGIDWANIDQYSEDMDPTDFTSSTGGPTPSASFAGSSVAASVMVSTRKTKTQRIRELVKEAERMERPLFRRQDASVVYGKGKYMKRDFFAILDEECPIEYFI